MPATTDRNLSALAFPIAAAIDMLGAPVAMLERAADGGPSLLAIDVTGLEQASRLLHDEARRAFDRAEHAIADHLPALRPADARELTDHDPEIRAEVGRFRDRYTFVDVTDLADYADPETWEIVAGGSDRYEVREVTRYEARRVGGAGQLEGWIVWDNEHNEEADDGDAVEALDFGGLVGLNEERARAVAAWLTENAPGRDPDTVWIVWDTANGNDARDGDRFGTFKSCGADDYDPTDEYSAKGAAERANLEDYRTNACGWPFAHNYAAIIEKYEAETFAAAGFVVACYKGDTYYAGIDGGGYDFTSAHWAPVVFAKLAYIRTTKGLRRVVE